VQNFVGVLHRNRYAGVAGIQQRLSDRQLGPTKQNISDLQLVLITSLGDRIVVQLGTFCNVPVVVASESYKRLILFTEVQFDAKNVPVNYMVVDESVDEVRVVVVGEFLERQSDYAAHLLVVLGARLVRNQDILPERVLA